MAFILWQLNIRGDKFSMGKTFKVNEQDIAVTHQVELLKRDKILEVTED